MQTVLAPQSLYNQSVALAINSSGDAVGSCFDYPQGGFPNVSQIALEFKSDGTIVRTGDLGGGMGDAYARGINDSGVIVGNDSINAFVNYTGTPGANVSLNSLLSPVSGAGWSLYYAYGIDDAGDIVGIGKTPAAAYHGFLLTPAMPGDANTDGTSDINDLTIVLAHYGQTGMTWTQGDFNGDGEVDINDLTIVLAHYGQSLGSSAAGLSAVPEPSSLPLAISGVVGLLAYAWRKRWSLASDSLSKEID